MPAVPYQRLLIEDRWTGEPSLEDLLEIQRQRMTLSEIKQTIWERTEVSVSLASISRWVNAKHEERT